MPLRAGRHGNRCTEDLVNILADIGYDTGVDLDRLIAAARRVPGIVGHDTPGQVAKAGKSFALHPIPESLEEYDQELLATTLLAASLPVAAADLPNVGDLTQSQFRLLSEDLGAALSYKGVTPATALGPWGFDLGLELSATDVQNRDVFRLAGNGSTDTLFVPKLHVYKG